MWKDDMRPEDGSVQEITLHLRNRLSKTITFYIEPWGDAHPMPPGAVFVAIARGPRGGAPSVEIGEDCMTLYGWSGSVVRVFYQGDELGAGAWERQPVPPVP